MCYRRLSEAYDRLLDRMSSCAKRIFGEEAVVVAMNEFLLWADPDEGITEGLVGRADFMFCPWFLFNWEYDSLEAELELSGPEGRTVAELYAEERGNRLDPLERNLIDHINRKPYSFLEVMRVDEGQGVQVKDILKGNRIDVQEKTGSEYLQIGDLLFGRAVSVDGVGMFIGLSPEILQLRKKMRKAQSSITDDELYDWDMEIRNLYFYVDRALHSPPQLCNTDGDPMELHRLVYDVSSAEDAFEKLCDLCVTMEPDELRVDAKQDDTGSIIHVEFPWDRQGHKASPGLSNTVLGHIVIDENRLIAETNSAERAGGEAVPLNKLLSL